MRVKAPLSKGAAQKLPEAISVRGIHAAELYEFARHFGESEGCTANPSTAKRSPSL